MTADESHLHHRLRRCGFSSAVTVLFLFCVSIGALSAFLFFSSSLSPIFSLSFLLLLVLPLGVVML
jgi:hypothetical protein